MSWNTGTTVLRHTPRVSKFGLDMVLLDTLVINGAKSPTRERIPLQMSLGKLDHSKLLDPGRVFVEGS